MLAAAAGEFPTARRFTCWLLSKSLSLSWRSPRVLDVALYPFSFYGNAYKKLEAAGPTAIAELVAYADTAVEWSDRCEPTLNLELHCPVDIPEF